jgi:hypothetical protein
VSEEKRRALAKWLRYCRHRSGSVRHLSRNYLCTGCAQSAMDAVVSAKVEQLKAQLAEALTFLKRCDTKDEIVSTGRLPELQIANARAAGLMYVEPGGGRGWTVRPSGPAPQWAGQQEMQEKLAAAEAKLAEALNGTPAWIGTWRWRAERAEAKLAAQRAALAGIRDYSGDLGPQSTVYLLQQSARAALAAPTQPDKNCVSLPDGSCVGTGCMHDAPTQHAREEKPKGRLIATVTYNEDGTTSYERAQPPATAAPSVEGERSHVWQACIHCSPVDSCGCICHTKPAPEPAPSGEEE